VTSDDAYTLSKTVSSVAFRERRLHTIIAANVR